MTSGTFSPTLNKSIAMAFVSADCERSESVAVDIRGKTVDAKIVKLPFYKASR